MTTRFADHLPFGDHASRPDPTTVPVGTLYACSDHNLVYQSDGATWGDWYVPPASGVLLLENGDPVPGGTAVGTLIFEKDA